MNQRPRPLWAFAITAIALFMVGLDNLVVTTVLPVIRRDLHASLQDLEWLVNAYTLTFAVLLLTGAALGDRFGRRRVFSIALAVFSLGSAAAALSPSSSVLIVARAVQGLAAAFITPLTLTILAASVPRERRALALGAWGGISGLAVAVGPLVGGAIAQGISWHWIFWVNVPIGLFAAVLAYLRLDESRATSSSLDLGGLALATGALFSIVWAVIHGNERGWTDGQIVAAFALGAVLLAVFAAWEARVREPMLPLEMFRSMPFSVANAISFLMFFGVFGSIFLLSQFFQVVQGLSPLDSGLRILPWTAMPAVVAPIAGVASGRIGGRPILLAGMVFMAIGLGWVAAVTSPTTPYGSLVPAFLLSGAGMGLFFAPIANVVLSDVSDERQGKASGAANTIRELGGVFGVAVLAAVFSGHGSYASPASYVAGVVPAVWLGAAVVAAGAVVTLALPARDGRTTAAIEARTAATELDATDGAEPTEAAA